MRRSRGPLSDVPRELRRELRYSARARALIVCYSVRRVAYDCLIGMGQTYGGALCSHDLEPERVNLSART